ncbi:glycosyltransferase family A protein [uncultured Bradyrhizobium sp.]|jgi:glycosyltransferase involved in cell wall biosynthesis|uniref:glycosyltransferase family 2 protein n=1 Tax=uncultured Bradyrhizobium sp. TaxID=199684 RepID=UPI002618AF75|nr:glycosyltransferase family A protein [uncultured Bradyrhizobium sp.]
MREDTSISGDAAGSKHEPLVTALINTYNYARFLPFAINSVLNQTYKNIEIIVVDDGSTDHTQEVLQRYAGRVTNVRTTNGGQAHAFNVGIPMARGELLMLLDADDIWSPNKVERMVEFAAERPQAAMLYHRFQNLDASGRHVGPPQPMVLTDGDYRHKYIRSGGSWWSPITSVLVFRPEHIKRALPIPSYGHREGADTVLTDFCAVTSEIASFPEVLAGRRLHGANLYANGRDDRTYRSKEIRESDVRRVEWRMFSLGQILSRCGAKFEINLDNNEWRTTNLYWLGRTSLWKILWASLRCPEHSFRERWHRFKWVRHNKKMYKSS